jgi:beta-lactamase regulating signal transducer with metallopeptidase domain
MDKLFLTILNMSLTGAFVIAAICVARLPLKKAPKIISYCLWVVAGFRLVFPFSIESVFSLIPFKAQTIPSDIAMQPIPRIDSGISFINNAVSSILPAATPVASINPLQIWITIGAYVWFAGVVIMLVYGIVSFVILKRKMRSAAHIEANIFEVENIKSPFVLGVFKSRIYLPIGLSEQEKSYIVLHEQTHIKRRDHIVKFTAYFILCLHWFNPFAWVAFLLMSVDMEMSCDERVLKEIGGETRKNYSLSLLSLETERRIISGSPLAFGEGGVKERIKNVLNFKKPSRVIFVAAIVLVAVLSVGFAVNKINAPAEPPNITVQSGDKSIEWEVGENGSTAIIDGGLVTFGIDRIKPETKPLKTTPQKTTPPEDTTLLSSWKPLHELPADYSKEQAIAAGVYVNIHGSEIYNQELGDVFYADVSAGSAAFMRVMQYTIEGDVIITDYQYDGDIFTVTLDSSRDKFMGSEDKVISSVTYKYLVPLNRLRPANVTGTYYLSNVENIFIGTEDGEDATLIDGLGWIPSPSDSVNN